jgi:hypothetical protein
LDHTASVSETLDKKWKINTFGHDNLPIAIAELLPVMYILKQFNSGDIFCDNALVVYWLRYGREPRVLKYGNFVKEAQIRYRQGDFSIYYINTKDNPADFFTREGSNLSGVEHTYVESVNDI